MILSSKEGEIMKKAIVFLIPILLAFGSAQAQLDVDLFVDSAPNVYGRPSDFNSWFNNAIPDVVNGTFTNMRNGHYPGQLQALPEDLTSYSFGDHGTKLAWLFWVPDISQQEFMTHSFEVKMHWDVNGDVFTMDWQTGNVIPNSPSDGWSGLDFFAETHSGGVVGVFTGGNWAASLHSSDTPAARQQLKQDLETYLGSETYMCGAVRWEDAAGAQQEELCVAITPEPTSMVFLGSALVGLVAGHYRKKRR
jgi:hypothetical protein